MRAFPPRRRCLRNDSIGQWQLAVLATLVAVAACRSTADDPSPSAEPDPSQPKPVQADPPPSPSSRPLPYKNVAMILPQPLPEPSPAEAPELYEPITPPWPEPLTPVFGSEIVARVKSSGKRGVLINAWASWCGPCKVEMPLLLEIRQRYLDRGIDVWFVSVDKPEQAQRVLEVLQERKVPQPHLVARGHLGYFKEALSPIWKGSLPSTFLFDAGGRVRYYWGAQILEGELTPLLDGYLAGKAIDGAANYRVRRGIEAP